MGVLDFVNKYFPSIGNTGAAPTTPTPAPTTAIPSLVAPRPAAAPVKTATPPSNVFSHLFSDFQSGGKSAASSFANTQEAYKHPTFTPGFQKFRDFSNTAVSTAMAPGTKILKPILEKAGVPSGVAGVAGFIGDIAAPGPGGKAKGAAKIVEEAPTIERGFISSVKALLPEAQKIAGQYIPRATDPLAQKARNLVIDHPAVAEKLALNGNDDVAVAVASEYIKKLGEDAKKATDPSIAAALYDKAANIANTLAPKLTEAGRSIQAASILGRLTPEGQVRFAAREIQKFNEAHPGAKIPELTGDQTKTIIDKMNEIEQIPDLAKKNIEFKKLQNTIQDLVPSPLVKKLTTIWKAGLLTGVKTSGLNIFSNLSHGISEVAKDVPATAVDSVASLFTGQRTKSFTTSGVAGGVKEGFQKGWDYLKSGVDARDSATKLDYHHVNFGKGPVAKAAKAYTETVFKVLGAEDQPFYYGALARGIAEQAKVSAINSGLKGAEKAAHIDNLVQNPNNEMIKSATADALRAVFQNETALGKAAKKIQDIPYVGQVIVPFGKTPAAVATQIINYTPIGLAGTILRNIGKGKFNQKDFAEGIGRGLTGTGVLAAGYQLAKNGLVALDRPTTEREQKLWDAEGRKPNTILVDGKWRSPAVLGPAGNVLLVGAHFQKALENNPGNPQAALTEGIFGSLKSFTEQTFLTGVNQVANALSDPQRFASTYINSLVSSLVPTIVADTAHATDPVERRAESTLQKVQARIPGARETLQPQVNVLGKDTPRIGNIFEVLADPTRPSADLSTPTTQELRRLTDAGHPVSPTQLGDTAGYKALSQEENTKIWEHAGKIINDKLTSLFSQPAYKALDDDKKAQAVDAVVRQAGVNSRVGMAIQLTQGLKGQQLKDKLSALKSGGLLNQEVFSKYLEMR